MYLSDTRKPIHSNDLMVKRKGSPKKHSVKKPSTEAPQTRTETPQTRTETLQTRTETPQHSHIYKGVKFIDIDADVRIHILNMLGLWNAKASELIPEDEKSNWGNRMEFKSNECGLGLFVKSGSVKDKELIAFMKGDLILSPKGSRKALPPTCYDIQPTGDCRFTISDADGKSQCTSSTAMSGALVCASRSTGSSAIIHAL